MFVTFDGNVGASPEEMEAYGLNGVPFFEAGEIYEMSGDQVRHWMDRGMCRIVEKQKKVKEKEPAVKEKEPEKSNSTLHLKDKK